MKRLVIVVLHEYHEPWKQSSQWCSGQYRHNDRVVGCRFVEVDNNKVIFLRQINDTTGNIKVIVEAEKSQYDEIYVAAHQGSVNWNEVVQITAGADFRGSLDDPIYKKLSEFALKPNFNNLNELYDTIKRKRVLTLVPRLTTLKHHLTFLFLPVDIDAQGLIEAKGNAQYWGNEGNPYINEQSCNLWEQAKRLVYGAGQQDTVEKMVSEAKKKAGDAGGICQAWEKVKTLLPDNEPPEVITQIFQDLGEAGSVDLEKLTCHWEQFHNWLVSLCEAMDKLRDEVEKLEQAK